MSPQLEELRRAAALLEEDRPGEPVPAQILDLLDPGSSLGGARPKNVVEDDDGSGWPSFRSAATGGATPRSKPRC